MYSNIVPWFVTCPAQRSGRQSSTNTVTGVVEAGPLRGEMLDCTRPLNRPDVLVVDPFDCKLYLVILDGGEVAEEVVNGVAVPQVAE